MALKTYPLDNVDYSAEDAELFHCTRTSGIYAGDDFDYSVTGADNTITIGPGIAWIRNSRFSGKVAALTAAMALDAGLPDAVYPRIDAVAIQFDANKNSTEVVLKRGTAASAPIPPVVSQSEALYELHLYHVRRKPGAAAISVSDITDLRLDPNYCGLMADSVTRVDTAAISAQVTALIEELRAEIGNVKDGSAYLMRSGGNMTGAINMNGQPINGLNAPTANDEAVNKGYVDANKVDKTSVVNNFTTTEEGFVADARALKVLNDTKLSMELLWQNASHASAFAAQVVSLDLSNYDQVAIVFGFDGNFQWLSGLCVFNKNLQTGARMSEVFDQYGISRKITKITDDGVYFGGSVLTTLGGGSYSDTNTHMIPYQIYGIKRGQVAA